MKNWRKLLAVCLTLALALGLFCANLSTVADETPKTWVDFEPQMMTSYDPNKGQVSFGTWFAKEQTGLEKTELYVANDVLRPHTSGYAAIRRLDVTATGNLYFEPIWGTNGISITAGSSGSTMDFGIVNQNHELIWPTNGDWLTLTKGEVYAETFSVPVTAGDTLYFIATNPSENEMSLNFHTIAYIANSVGSYGTQVHSSGFLCGSNMNAQGNVDGNSGKGKWYYMYAPSVELTTADPNGVSDMGQDVYEATYTTQPMTAISDQNTGYIGAGSYGSTSFSQGMNLYLKAGQTNIVRFTAPTDGTFDIGYCGVEMIASKYYPDAWTADKGVDFAIVNQDGEVLYPAYGGPAQLRGTDNPSDKATVPSRFYVYNMKAGDYLDFVYKPTATTPAFGTAYITTSGSFSFNGTRMDSSGRLGLNYSEAQGTRNVQMLYSTDFTFGKRETSAWTEYVQLKTALTAVPATTEVQVCVPEDVSDWKVGTVISDMNGVDGTGYAVMMDTFGRPRFISGNVDWTADVDIRTGEWTRLTFTADTANHKLSLYVDGVLADETTLADDAALAVSGKAPVIGNDRSYVSTTAFQGAMKKLALSASVSDAAVELAAANATHYWLLNGVYTDKVADNDGKLTTVNSMWYDGEPADAADDEYTVVHIGDMQVTSDFLFGTYPQVTQWIADNADRLNIQTVVNTGDLVNNEEDASQWEDAKNGMQALTDNNIAMIFAAGNHEYPSSGTKSRTPTSFNKHFPIEKYLMQGTQEDATTLLYAWPNTTAINGDVNNLTVLDKDGNVVDDTTGILVDGVLASDYSFQESLENAVYAKIVNGKPQIFITLEVQPRKSVIDGWAKTVVEALEASETYKDAPITIATHHYLTTAGKIDTSNGCFTEAHRTECYTPAELYTAFISQYKNIKTVLCGHVADDVATRTDIGVNGNKIVSIMNDQSYEGNGGEGVILLLRYRADGTVKAEYYSPILGQYYQASNQFEYDTKELEIDQYWLDFDAVQMEYFDGSKTWSSYAKDDATKNIHQAAMAYAEKGGRAAIRTFVAPKAGTFKAESIWGATGITIGKKTGESVKFAITDGDGKVLWPTDGKPAILAGGSVTSVTLTDVTVAAGDKIHFVAYSPSTSSLSVTMKLVIRIGSTQYQGNGGNLVKDGEIGTQGATTWYFDYAESVSELTYNPNDPTEGVKTDCTVTYGVDGEGGTISATTSDTWGKTSCVVPTGGTVRFTTKPAPGYRFAGYCVDGKLVTAYRQYTMSNISSDRDVKALFVPIKLEGDANGDGKVDILDLVNMNNGVANDTAFADKSVCDLVDSVAAADGVDVIDAADVKELRKRILN